MKPFEHTSKEKGMWRGWLKNGQSLEITWPRTSIGAKIGYHDHSRHLWIGLGIVQAFIPLGLSQTDYPIGDEPSWGIDASLEFGLTFSFGNWRKHYDWPWDWDWHRTSYLLADGSWVHELRNDRPGVNKKSRFETNFDHYQYIREIRDTKCWRQDYPYTYVLQSGEVQERVATVSIEEFEYRRKCFRWLPWFARVKRSIDVRFNDEVGERTGSWKGGTIGCGYDMLPGETAWECLRRMEAERDFR